ncbi:MAG: acyltransferase [Treponema sp.]|jgi:1-acyl-sn-glycerol-3-phosphate acyltransferase|nr:acyltransferase [Treponema sp.]
MYKPYIKPVFVARPDITVPAPKISKFVLFVCRLFGRIYLFFILGIAKIVLRGGEHIFKAFEDALSGKSRCILAFRHPNGGEPQLIMWYILYKLRSAARKARYRFSRRPHVSFVYGYEVVRWGGGVARWIMPNLGAMPIHHAKMDSVGMDRIFRSLSEGPYPLAIAPEGQVSYTTETVPRLEQGTVRIGFQAAERINKEGKECPVEILPVSIHFRYGKMGKWSLGRLIKKIEKYTGLDNSGQNTGFTGRLERARRYILEQNEKRYGVQGEEGKSFNERVDRIIEKALETAERLLGISPKGKDTIERMYHIRQICWDSIIIPEVKGFNGMPLVERALADLKAGEAWHAGRHMELVDFIWYFRVAVPREDAPLYVKMEYAQNLWDFASRTMGGAYSNRVLNVHPKRVLIQIAPKIDLSARLSDYKKNKKQAIGEAMDDLVSAFQGCIHEAAEYQI